MLLVFYMLIVCCIGFLGLDEPGKQVRSAVRIKNTSKSHVAFKVCIAFHIHSSFIIL